MGAVRLPNSSENVRVPEDHVWERSGTVSRWYAVDGQDDG